MKIREELLYYIWKCQYFDANQLTTTEGEPLKIFSPGVRNHEAGPDFLGASVQLGSITWHGHVELHVQSSDWKSHKHHTDPSYGTVVLHVVWQDDIPLYQQDGTRIPTLTLADKVPEALLEQACLLMGSKEAIPCASQWNQVQGLIKNAMLDRVLFQRLAYKKGKVGQLWEETQGNWEEVTYQLLAYALGSKANSQAMLGVAQQLPAKIIKLHRNNIQALEALLLGQANLLQGYGDKAGSPVDPYHQELTKLYAYMAHKYNLPKPLQDATDWKFFKVRPNNFPTIRLAQLAQLLSQHPSWFDWLLYTPVDTLRNQLAVVQSDYWQKHYMFGKPVKKLIPGLGQSHIEHILINSLVPLLVTYAKIYGDLRYIDQAINLLHTLPAEENAITKQWKAIGLKVKTAFDSQASIELFNDFCSQKRCLSCHIGAHLVRNPTA